MSVHLLFPRTRCPLSLFSLNPKMDTNMEVPRLPKTVPLDPK